MNDLTHVKVISIKWSFDLIIRAVNELSLSELPPTSVMQTVRSGPVRSKPGRSKGFPGPRVTPGHGLARSGYPGPIR